ncbi:MAG: hypothetical protein JWM82_1817 [Myxococcales bacterium]|nr:hypothetical protein [Myxococcales bacterium]
MPDMSVAVVTPQRGGRPNFSGGPAVAVRARMKRTNATLTGAVLAAAFAVGGCDAVASKTEAQGAASSWAAGQTGGWSVEIESAAATDAVARGPVATPCTNDLFWLRSSTREAELDLFFDCPGSEVVDLTWLRAHLRDYNLARLPIEFGAPGWTFRIFPPSSALTEGLTFDSWTQGVLSLRIETPLQAIHGESQSSECRRAGMVADAPLPQACFVEVPFAGPLVLTLKVPLASETFRL